MTGQDGNNDSYDAYQSAPGFASQTYYAGYGGQNLNGIGTPPSNADGGYGPDSFAGPDCEISPAAASVTYASATAITNQPLNPAAVDQVLGAAGGATPAVAAPAVAGMPATGAATPDAEAAGASGERYGPVRSFLGTVWAGFAGVGKALTYPAPDPGNGGLLGGARRTPPEPIQ